MGYNMNGFSGFGNSPAKQKDIGKELQEKYKGAPQTTDASGKLTTGTKTHALTQEQRTDLEKIAQKNQKSKSKKKPRNPKVVKLEKTMAKNEKGFNPPKEGGAYLFPKSPGALARKKKQQERYWDAQQERSQILFQKKN